MSGSTPGCCTGMSRNGSCSCVPNDPDCGQMRNSDCGMWSDAMNLDERPIKCLSLRSPQSAVRNSLLVLYGLAALASSGSAIVAAESPYRLLICLQFSEDPLFTRLY